MVDTIKFLLEWAEHYFKSRDAFRKEIVSIDKKEDRIIINFSNRSETVIAVAELENLKESELQENTAIITLNNRKNVDCLYFKWNRLKDFVSLRIYFINPFSNTDKKWIIAPHIHHKICDEQSLRAGLIAMFETVEPLTTIMLETQLGSTKP